MRFIVFILVLCLASVTGFANPVNDEKPVADRYQLIPQSDGIDDQLAGLFSKHRYCVRCGSGERLNCNAPVGGEGGRALCGGYGVLKCQSKSGQVDYNGCN